MKCDLDNMVTYLVRGHLSSTGMAEDDVQSVYMTPECGGSGERLGSIRATNRYGQSCEVRRILDNQELNELVNDKAQLNCLAADVRRIREN